MPVDGLPLAVASFPALSFSLARLKYDHTHVSWGEKRKSGVNGRKSN